MLKTITTIILFFMLSINSYSQNNFFLQGIAGFDYTSEFGLGASIKLNNLKKYVLDETWFIEPSILYSNFDSKGAKYKIITLGIGINYFVNDEISLMANIRNLFVTEQAISSNINYFESVYKDGIEFDFFLGLNLFPFDDNIIITPKFGLTIMNDWQESGFLYMPNGQLTFSINVF